MTPADLARVHQAAFTVDRAWSASEFTQLLGQANVHLCGTLQCFALFRVLFDEAELLTIATDPADQRRGWARLTLQQAENSAATLGAEVMILEVAEDNTPARALYSAMGYHAIATRPRYYARPNGIAADALVLRKTIHPLNARA